MKMFCLQLQCLQLLIYHGLYPCRGYICISIHMDISIQSHVYIILQEIHDDLHGFSITVGLQVWIRFVSVEIFCRKRTRLGQPQCAFPIIQCCSLCMLSSCHYFREKLWNLIVKLILCLLSQHIYQLTFTWRPVWSGFPWQEWDSVASERSVFSKVLETLLLLTRTHFLCYH